MALLDPKRHGLWTALAVVLSIIALWLASDASRVADELVDKRTRELERLYDAKIARLEIDNRRMLAQIGRTRPRVQARIVVTPAANDDQPIVTKFVLGDEAAPDELLWIYSFSVSLIDPATRSPEHADDLIRATLDAARTGFHRPEHPRLFVASSLRRDLRLPIGFAVPISSNHELTLTTQVRGQHDVRLEVEFVRDADLVLRPHAILPVQVVTSANATVKTPPGGGVHHTKLSDALGQDAERTVHCVVALLPASARSLELVDRTSSRRMWRALLAVPPRHPDHQINAYRSRIGFTLYASRDYEIVVHSDNTTNAVVESNVDVLVYYADPLFQVPTTL